MVLKQASQTCYCGLPMEFPEAEVKTKCLCGALWVLGPEGYWYTQGPIITTETIKTKSSRYERYMSRRNKRKGKGGRR
ncbi:hypothetical protein [Desulfosporosinus sp. FKB]|uniref:hypothetical protein n=1 Tax=Desulfosporosinus sp. FKB TaxID=1969835 RepID=UPI000B4A536D|nr:hypothetical protein [Desulfosporosinus sp. FKB]